MRILLVHNYYTLRGGTDDYVDSLYELLGKNKQGVYLYTERSNEIQSTRQKIQTGLNLILAHNTKIGTVLDRIKPDICHLNNLFPLLTFDAIKQCKKRYIPVIQTIHDFKYFYPGGIIGQKEYNSPFFINHPLLYTVINKGYNNSYFSSLCLSLALWKNKNTLQNIDAFIFPNKTSEKILREKLLIDEKKCFYLPHFVKRQINPDMQQKDKYFIYVGRISDEKGIVELVDVFRSLPYLHLVVVGDGPLLSKLKSLKTPNIKFLGYISSDKKYELLSKALFCIIPSKIEEQGPLVLIESFMCGTPVIVPDLPSFKEKVKNNLGFLYKQGDKIYLKKRILDAANQEWNLYKKMRALVLDEYSNHFSEVIYYKNLLRVYGQAITNKN